MSARPYRLTYRWHDGRKGSQCFATRKAAEVRKADIEAVAAGLRDGSWALAVRVKPTTPAPGEVIEFDETKRLWITKVPAASVTCRITKKASA